jgi:hypothetical protein
VTGERRLPAPMTPADIGRIIGTAGPIYDTSRAVNELAAAFDRLTAERDALRAAVARVEALAQQCAEQTCALEDGDIPWPNILAPLINVYSATMRAIDATLAGAPAEQREAAKTPPYTDEEKQLARELWARKYEKPWPEVSYSTHLKWYWIARQEAAEQREADDG